MSVSSWLTTAISGIAVPVAIALALLWFVRRYPVHADASDPAVDDAEPISGGWTVLSVALWIVCIPAIAFGIVTVARALNELIASSPGRAAFLLTPSLAWWYLYGGFSGVCLSWSVIGPAMRWLMGANRFARWTHGHDLEAGFDTERAMWLLCIVVMVPLTLAFLPSLGCHTRFSETEIGIQTYADLREARYDYGDVAAIAVVEGYRDRAGRLHKARRVLIDFKDGRRWSSSDSFLGSVEINPDLAAFLAVKTGLTYTYVEDADDLKGQ